MSDIIEDRGSPELVLAPLPTIQTVGVLLDKCALSINTTTTIGNFQTLSEGWPIGSGMVESANKLVVGARLKGAGMHWSHASVNPLLALRNAVRNDRWAEAWQQSAAHIRRFGVQRRAIEPKRKAGITPEAVCAPAPPAVEAQAVERVKQRKPAADHPWRRTYQATKARMQAEQRQAKL